MCGIFKCNRAGKYIGYYNNLSEAVYHNPNAQKDWFFTNGETLSVWMFDGLNWVDTSVRASNPINLIDDPNTFVPSVVAGEPCTYLYIATKAGTYVFNNFNNISIKVSEPCLISLNWDGYKWSINEYAIPIPESKSNDTLPNIEVRFLNKGVPEVSEIFGSKEGNPVKYSYVEFRISEQLDYINKEKDNIYIGLFRWRSRSVATKGYSKKKYFIVSDLDSHDEYRDNSYPNGGDSMGYYEYGNNGFVFWSPTVIRPKKLSDILQGDYNGEWIRFPYSMEEIMRRFVYIRNQKGINSYEVLPPLVFFKTSGAYTELVCCGRYKVQGEEVPKPNCVTMSLGIGLCMRDFEDSSNNQHWITGDMIPFKGRIVKPDSKDEIHYNGSLYNKHIKFY